ncbi:MAG TPA: acyl-CoA dehydrogenase family protein [Acidimicrobiales bacterium]|nr:acyl-CoA dehydrogenase family protein [Acidimicrobiales bacterium]
MELTFTEEQRTITELADRILAAECSPEVLRSAERDEPRSWPREAWIALADAGLTGIGLPEAAGGGGYGLCEAALVVQAVARAAAPLPAYATLVLGAAPIAAFGSEAQRARWLPGVVDGSRILTGVLVGEHDAADPPVCEHLAEGGRRVSGVGWYVPFGADADAYVVPVARVDGDVVLAVIEADAPGVSSEPLAPMSGEPSAIVRFDATPVDDDALLSGSLDGVVEAHRWLRDRAVAATCVAQVGTCEGALALTASYVSTREQFGSKLATFQAVAHRAADAWIDTELVRLTAWRALWRLDTGLVADDELAVAKHFTAEAAQRVVAAAQHLHGGIGMDLDYPVHRYFRWAKEHEQRLGGGAEHLAALGRSLAERDDPVPA